MTSARPDAAQATPSRRPAEPHLLRLKERLAEVTDLRAAAAVLAWDQSTYMPPEGAAARGRQLATLQRLAHERFVDAELGRWLDALERHRRALPPEHPDARLLDVVRRDYERDTRVPVAFQAEWSEHGAASFQAWSVARGQNDVRAMLPYLERTVALCRRYAGFFPEAAHPADPLIDQSDEGMTVASLRPLFAELRGALVPLVERLVASPGPDTSVLARGYPEDEQLALGLELARALGYDLRRGRQDLTHHPFATRFCNRDVRITTRVRRDDLGDALFSTLHEAGHALYEQGIDDRWEGTPLAQGTSSGVHESQSRLWENQVGRSLAFWRWAFPLVRRRFPRQTEGADAETLYRAVNRVGRTLIRTDADEVTYNLHVIVRFDLELELLEGRLEAADLRDAWNARYRDDLGVEPPDDAQGVLQDVHWFAGVVGGEFQGYALGNVLSAQFFEAAERELGDLGTAFEQGRFAALHDWLREHIYAHGRSRTPSEIVQAATGRPMTSGPYLRYLRSKYGALYGLDAGALG